MSIMGSPGGEEMSMKNDDLENNLKEGEQASSNVIEENRIESSEERSDEVEAHGWCLLPKRTYDSIKQNKAESWREIDDQSLQQESPKGNTVLHVAALYGNDRCVERILEICPAAELLRVRNGNGDTPLHVAARADLYSFLVKADKADPKRRIRLASADMKMRQRIRREIIPNQGVWSPAIVAILKQNKGILEKIINKKKEWIHVKDDIGRNALHYVASIGYLYGVEYLLQNCHSCNMERDKDGFFPLHLASAFGHTEVLKKLLAECPNPREIVDNNGRNIVHIAAIMGRFNVVRYILQDENDGFKDMINDKDHDGNTPLHLTASHSRPKVVQALTWVTRVNLHCLNNNNQTALDAFEQFKQENNPPFPQMR